MSYNGHKNWNHWNVSLWINNDEGLYNLALDCIAQTGTKDDAADSLLFNLKLMGATHTPDGARYSRTALRAALLGL